MIISGTPIADMFEQSFFNISQYLDALVVGLLWTFGFIILLNQKLNSENADLRNQFELIFNTSPDAVLITRLDDGLFFDCNDGYTKLTGYTKTDMFSRTVLDINLWKNSDDRKAVVKQIMAKGFCENYEAFFQRKDREVFAGLLSAKTMLLKGVPHLLSVTRDISEKMAAQEKERKYISELKELNAVKDRLFSILGHDLRSPFSSIIGFSGLLIHDFRKYSDEEIEMMLTEIHKSGERTYKLLDDLLNWARLQTGQTKIHLTKTDLDIIIRDSINPSIIQAVEKKIELSYIHPASCPLVTDENIVNTILRNFISNAIKFTDRGGIISIKKNEIDGFMQIQVSDNGIGMPEEIKNGLFTNIINATRYGTANERGTGLGLAICKELIERDRKSVV
jgi:PAS domain S-box-containing protein